MEVKIHFYGFQFNNLFLPEHAPAVEAGRTELKIT